MTNGDYTPAKKGNLPQKIKILLIITAILGAILLGTMAITYFTADISAAQAMQIAQNYVGSGTATTPDLDWEIWRWLWNVEVLNPETGLIHELYIHPNTGAIVRQEISIWD
ncbi:MAG: PepSY domain-containing protein [Defluviitaleaceae bacterium]|nr:PepSY domain-containing protein [Defluviitaleaceae bacterium]